AVITLATEHDFPEWVAQGTSLRGWALTHLGKEEGIAQLRQGSANLHSMGVEIERLSSLTLLAEVYKKVGRSEEGLALLAETITAVHKTKAHWLDVELYRLKGELTLESRVESYKSKVEEAEEYFLKAIE